jgi:hypothetical protein
VRNWERCEWDPSRNYPAVEDAKGNLISGCPYKAVYSVTVTVMGVREPWHVCSLCVERHPFKRAKIRRLLSGTGRGLSPKEQS